MSVKYFDKTKNKWVVFPGTVGDPGKSAYELAVLQGYEGDLDEWLESLRGAYPYEIAVEKGYTGTEEEYNELLYTIPTVIEKFEDTDRIPTTNSTNLVLSGGVKQAIDNLNKSLGNEIEDQSRILKDSIDTNSANINNLTTSTDNLTTYTDHLATDINNLTKNVNNISATVNSLTTNGSITKNVLEIQKNGAKLLEWNGSIKGIANIEIPSSLSDLNPTQQDIIDALGYTPANSTSAGSGNVTGPTSSTNSNFAAFNGINGKTIKDSGYNFNSFAAKTHTHSVSSITGLGNLATKDKVDKTDLNFSIPEGTAVDSNLNVNSTNPVQNKIITEALNSKANNSSLSNYYTKSEVNEKISSTGSGGITASGDLAVDYIITGAGTKSIKNSGQTLSNLALKSEIPTNLPNKYALSIKANNVTTTYAGGYAVNIDLDTIFSRRLPILTDVSDAGNPGIFYYTGTTNLNINARVTSEQPDAIVIVPCTTTVSFNPKSSSSRQIYMTAETESLAASIEGNSIKCFSISWVHKDEFKNIILINGTVYEIPS